MKEVKEVVHVQTRELAEEVLRVAKKNGLMKNLDLGSLNPYYNNTCFELKKVSDYGVIEFYKNENYKIITAQEFLNRYKPKFKPIAMKCTQEQFDTVNSKLVGCKIEHLSSFEESYLVNNYAKEVNNITNVYGSAKADNNRKVFEEWNEKTFLECCGIEVKDEVNELEQLRKENENLKAINENLNKESIEYHNELTLLKEKLKAIEDQPKAGDVCLFWDNHTGMYVISKLNENGGIDGVGKYDNYIKATDENIQSKIEELKND